MNQKTALACLLTFWMASSLMTHSLLQAQDEFLKSLPNNPVLVQAQANIDATNEKGFRIGFGDICNPPTRFRVAAMTQPECKKSNGNITLSIADAPAPYTYQLLGYHGTSDSQEMPASTNDDEITFEDKKAGAYFAEVVDGDGIIHNIEFVLDNEGTVSNTNWRTIDAFCSNIGEVYRNAFDPIERSYRIYDLEGNNLADLTPTDLETIELPLGVYYARAQDNAGCQAYFIFRIKRQPTIDALPLIEDFSTSLTYPDLSVWADDYAFINQTLSTQPISIGMATLDGLNADGLPYQAVEGNQETTLIDGTADQLTSRPFCFNEIGDVSTLYIQFYYQAQGLGDFPNQEDSLYFEIKNADEEWTSIWKVGGFVVSQEEDFVAVNLTIDNAAYFFEGFQFRFRNRATISGQNDHWHIDYIQIDKEPIGDQIRDVTHVAPVTTILQHGYQAMPWNQFINHLDKSLADFSLATVWNHLATAINLNDQYVIRDVCEDEILDALPTKLASDGCIGGSLVGNMAANSINNLCLPLNELEAELQIRSEDDAFVEREEVVLETEWTLIPNVNDELNVENDTIFKYQPFLGYYAYDDATAERVYGLFGTGAQLASRFVLNEPDMLTGIQINFVNMNADVSGNDFKLMVWKGVEEFTNESEIIYEGEADNVPQYLGEVNGFWTFAFPEPIAVEDTFYIGFEQGPINILNIGFDVNNDASENLFLNTNAVWFPSIFEGAVMMRPFFNEVTNDINVGVEEPIVEQASNQDATIRFALSPNPTNGQLQINVPNNLANSGLVEANSTIAIQVFDLYGRLLQQTTDEQLLQSGQSQMDVAALNTGIYFLQLQDESSGRLLGVERFVRE